MERTVVAQLRGLLEQQRRALLEDGDIELEPESGNEPVHKPDEDAAPLAEMNQVIASNRNRERTERLREIDAALGRMHEDPEGFGSCEECDEAIGMRRLELMPWVRLCIDCQTAQETDGQPLGRRHITDFR